MAKGHFNARMSFDTTAYLAETFERLAQQLMTSSSALLRNAQVEFLANRGIPAAPERQEAAE